MADLIVSILVLLVAARMLGELFERFRQSSMIGEILAGIILGPAILHFIGEAREMADLSVVASLGTFMIVLLAGLEMNMEDISRAIRRGGVLVGAMAFTLPFFLGYFTATVLGLDFQATLVLSLAVAITALPVSVRILLDLGLTGHLVGRTIVSVAVLDDLTALTLLGIILSLHELAVVGFEATFQVAVITVIKTAVLVSIVITAGQMVKMSGGVTPGATRRVRQLLSALRGREALFAFSILFVLAFASMAELLGLHFVVGTFFGGLLLSVRLLGEHNFKQVERTTSAIAYGFLAPIFFGYIGLRIVPDAILHNPVLTGAIFGIAILGKVAGGYIGARLARLPRPYAFPLGIGLNARGMMEIVVASLAFELGIIGAELFSILVLMAVVTTMMTPPLLRWAVTRADRAVAASEGPKAEVEGAPPQTYAAAAGGAAARAAASDGAMDAPVVVVGGGRVAVEIARAIGPCTILERDPQQARTLPLLLTEVRVVIGEASNKDDLRKAGVAAGSIVLAVTDNDESNEFVVRFAQSVGARRVIARTDRPAEVDRLRALGADAVVNMALETASAVLLEMYPPDVSMTELFLQRGSPAVGRPLSSFDVPRGIVLRSVSRRGKVLLPTPELVLESRDTIIMGGSPSGLARAREMLVGPHAGVRPFGVLAVLPRDVEAAESLALEVGPVAGRSGGGLVVAVPWETSDGDFARSVEQTMADHGLSATVVKGYSLAPGDLIDALAAARGPGVSAEGRRGAAAPADEDGSTWILAVPAQSIGKGAGRVTARRVVALPSLIGAPVLVARGGVPPRSMVALIDGAEGADHAATLACELALLTGARLTLLVATHEGEPEPREQAAFISGYARSIGLNHVEETTLEDPNPSAIERRLKGKVDWLVAASVPRALRGRDLAAFAASGDLSILLV